MFSEKYGYKEPKEVQYEKIDPSLRNRIWNIFYKCVAGRCEVYAGVLFGICELSD